MQIASNATSGEKEVAGLVTLEMPFAQTGPFRAVVQKLLVLPEYRQMGIAKRMMLKLEEVARREGRALLVSLFFESLRKRDLLTGTGVDVRYGEGKSC